MAQQKPLISDGLVLIASLAFAIACGGTPDVVSGPAADYSLSLTPSALPVAQRATGNTVVAVTRTNFSGAITLGLANAPSGVTAVFDPEAPAAGSSTLTVSVGGAVAPGSYDLTVTGVASVGNRSTPLVLTVSPSGGGTAMAVAVGGLHACALAGAGAAYCWGSNTLGQLGNGTIANGTWTPSAVAGGLRFSAIAAGGEGHTCAMTSSGAAYCWGGDYYGALGNGSSGGSSNSPIPVAVLGDLSFSSLALGPGAHSCGLIGSGAAYCWGANYYGGLGDGSQADKSTPVAVSGGLTYTSLAPGGQHTCALTIAGEAFCWGLNGFGQLATASSALESCMVNGFPAVCSTRPLPVSTPGGLPFVALASGESHTCALASSGAAYCWGRNLSGQLGDGSTTNRSVPVAVSGSARFTRIGGGSHHTCGITGSGAAYCWGSNSYGQLGDGSTTNSPVPVAVAGGLTFKSIDGGIFVTCGLATADVVYCWGFGTNSLIPVAVAGWP